MFCIPTDVIQSATKDTGARACVLESLVDELLLATADPAFSDRHGPAEKNLLRTASEVRRILGKVYPLIPEEVVGEWELIPASEDGELEAEPATA